ncbi:MAG TPA: serine/threonine-protein kinase [Pseudomonadota bacterium]|nr:serine/threonine-protein kinase [Pseudomonadota bacterium]
MGGKPCLEIGQAIGSYEVVRKLGEGGMGEVYEVFDAKLDRRAALKVVPPDLALNQDVVRRFQREAKALSQLRHPGIVHVFVYGVLPSLRNAPYFIMEYLEGETLRARIQRATHEPPGYLGISYLPMLQQIAKALAAVHQRGLVHRDLKPSNIILVADPDAPRGERAKLLDFGIVKVLQKAAVPSDDIEGPTQLGMLLGTPLYMAPEQWTNQRRLDGKTDVYSLGVMMFLVLTGRMPFHAADMPDLCLLHCKKTPPRMDSFDQTLPAALVELVARMLAKDPRRRPAMEEVAAILDTLQGPRVAPNPEQMLSEPSELELIMDAEGDQSSCMRAIPPSMMAGEHLPLRDPPAPGPGWQPAERPLFQTMLVPSSAVSSLPHWEDDRVTAAKSQTVGPVPFVEPTNASHASELSDRSLLVGSQYNLRPVGRYGGWISTAALVAVVLLIVRLNSLHSGAPPGRTELARSLAELPPPAPPRSPASARPPAEVVALVKLKKDCQHMIPTPSCVGKQHLTAPQQAALFKAFLRSGASLCRSDRLVVAGLSDAPRLLVQPESMRRKARARLLHKLKQLPSSLGMPAQLEVLCPDPE